MWNKNRGKIEIKMTQRYEYDIEIVKVFFGKIYVCKFHVLAHEQSTIFINKITLNAGNFTFYFHIMHWCRIRKCFFDLTLSCFYGCIWLNKLNQFFHFAKIDKENNNKSFKCVKNLTLFHLLYFLFIYLQSLISNLNCSSHIILKNVKVLKS